MNTPSSMGANFYK